MELNAAKELKLAGQVSHVVITERVEDIELSGRRIELLEPVTLDISYSFDGEGINLTGTLSSVVKMNCTRCNEEFAQPFSVQLNERFLKVSESEAEELECYTYAGETLDLDKMVQDAILLNAPIYGVCKPDCKGLCPVCGTNLNITQCSCCETEEDNPFAVLRTLLKDQ